LLIQVFLYFKLDFQQFGTNKLHMHNIKLNFDKFYQIITQQLKDYNISEGNFKFYPRKPKMNDCDILVLALCSEAMSVDSKLFFGVK
jgi:hypothetical protein